MEKFILVSGRPGTGKTELILHYCNKYPETTLLLAAEYSEKYIKERGLSDKVKVIGKDEFYNVELSKYKSICIDYIELFDENFLRDVIEKSLEKNIRIIALSQMRRNFEINNIFRHCLKKCVIP